MAAIAKKAHDERNQFDLNAAKKEFELLKISKEEKRHRDEKDLKQIKQDVEQMYLDLKVGFCQFINLNHSNFLERRKQRWFNWANRKRLVFGRQSYRRFSYLYQWLT